MGVLGKSLRYDHVISSCPSWLLARGTLVFRNMPALVRPNLYAFV